MRPVFKEVQKAAAKVGGFRAKRPDYIQRNVDVFGNNKVTTTDFFIAKEISTATAMKPRSLVETLGEAPNGFGKFVTWAPDDEKIAVIAFLSAADFMGVMISGVTKFDTITIESAAGLASFSEDIENEGAASFIGLLGAGASIGTSIFGAPQFVPIIKQAEEFAKSQFKEQKVKTKRRDVFGVDPKGGHKARQEGGVAISMPFGLTQTFMSGGDDLEAERWIKKPGDRNHRNLPEHMKDKRAFFIQPGPKIIEQAREDGDILIYPFDHIFEDNFGFYRLDIILERRDSKLPGNSGSDENVE